MNIMIQNQENIQYYKQQDQLSKQISQYKRINASLKKKIQARDKKITYLFSVMDPMSKSSIQSGLDNVSIKKNRSQIENGLTHKKDACFTEPKQKQKQNLGYIQQSIFKQKEADYGNVSERFIFKLPVLERKNLFAENPQGCQSKPRIVKIAIQKLIPLKPQDVKKKFQSKFK